MESGGVGDFIANRCKYTSNRNELLPRSWIIEFISLIICELIHYFYSFTTCSQSNVIISTLSVRISSINENSEDGCLGIDSHVDMSCSGRHARIVGIKEGKTSTVYVFDDSMKPSQSVRAVHVAYAYNTEDGKTFILRVNHCLDFTKLMHHSILCTNQSRANSIQINDCPTMYNELSTQSIQILDKDIQLPIEFNGTVPFIPIRYPTDEEWDTCHHIHLTAEEGWDMNITPLNHKISSLESEENILDSYLLHRDLLDRLHATVQLSSISRNNKASVNPKILASM